MEEIKVLICNKNTEARENLKRAIQFDQILNVVGFAYSGEEALRVVTDLAPEVVLLDLDMGDMDGIEVAKRVNSNSRSNVNLFENSNPCS